jgi:serine/threonine protein kinase
VKADIWAAGVTLYCMVYLQYPFFSNNFMEIFELIKSSQLKFEHATKKGEEWKNDERLHSLIRSILDRDVNNRLSIDTIVNNQWF